MSSWVSLEFGIASHDELCCRKRERFSDRSLRVRVTHAAAFSFCREIRRPWAAELDAAASLRPLRLRELLSLNSPSANYAVRTNLTAGANYAGRAPRSEIGHIAQLYHLVNSRRRQRERERECERVSLCRGGKCESVCGDFSLGGF